MILILALVGVASPPSAAETLRVLFVGNSLTYVNDVPAMVAALARERAIRIEVGTVAAPNASLEDHWNDGDGGASHEIAAGRWDVVVLQQGPSSRPSSRDHLIEFANRFAAEIRAAGARPALYGVWIGRSRIAALDDAIDSYALAAEACDCRLLPVGLAWKEAWAHGRRAALYGPDGFHPSGDGSYLAALVIWAGLTGSDPRSAPSSLDLGDRRIVSIGRKRAAVYREAAATALGRNLEAPPGRTGPPGGDVEPFGRGSVGKRQSVLRA